MTIIDFEDMPGWAQLSWIESWAYANNACEYCAKHIGMQDGLWGVFSGDEDVRASNMPKRLWFLKGEDALRFRLGFDGSI